MKNYRYTRLPPGHSEIRLVRLQPGVPGSDSPIEVEIIHAKLADRPAYEALSYVWGSSKRTDSVTVLVRPRKSRRSERRPKPFVLRITNNLAIALRHLRQPMEARTIWVDAICINQDDPVERSSEVLEMGSIYRNAQEVIVWLGPKSNDSDLALETLRIIGDGVIFNPEKRWMGLQPGSWPAMLNENPATLISHADRWFAVKGLITREWFSRLWVFQEIVLARKARLCIGEHWLDWGHAVDGLQWIWMMAEKLDLIVDSLEIGNNSATLEDFMYQGCTTSSRGALDVLAITCQLSCQDPRDRLYAIRSLVFPWERELISPDYSQSIEEVYTEFARRWLFELRNANLLSGCCSSDISSSNALPSWVSDWHCLEVQNHFSGNSSGMSQAFPAFIGDDKIGIQGVLIGTVASLTPPANSSMAGAGTREICCSWKALLSNTTNGSDIDLDAFMETIVTGKVSELGPSDGQILPTFNDLKLFLNGSDGSESAEYLIRAKIKDRCLLQTNHGQLGLSSQSARVGDCVAVVLGCAVPIILRPEKASEQNCFRVIGPCYISGHMKSEALLGSLPPGWTSRYEPVEGNLDIVFTNGDHRTQQDPRMPLPPKWRYIYGDEDKETEAERVEDMLEQWFESTETGKKTFFDPRLTPELLRERGVAIQELVLV